MVKQNIGYYGCATIKVLKGKRVVRTITHHNNGTAWLFRLLASTLCGRDESSNMPKFLDLLHDGVVEGNSTLVSSLATKVSLTSKVLENVNVSVPNGEEMLQLEAKTAASFTAFVPASLMINQYINAIAIYSDAVNNNTKLAEIKLDDLVDLTPKRPYNLMIEWTMTFNNVIVDA